MYIQKEKQKYIMLLAPWVHNPLTLIWGGRSRVVHLILNKILQGI